MPAGRRGEKGDLKALRLEGNKKAPGPPCAWMGNPSPNEAQRAKEVPTPIRMIGFLKVSEMLRKKLKRWSIGSNKTDR